MATSTISAKGQVTIPLHVMRRLGLSAGDRIEFVEIENGMFAIHPVNDDVRSLKGLLRKPLEPVSVEDMNVLARHAGFKIGMTPLK